MGNSRVDLLESNVRKLIGLLEQSRSKLKQLEKEKEELRKKLDDTVQKHKHVESTDTSLNLKKQTEKNQEMRKQLDLFIEELDTCIDMVEKM